VVLVEIGWGLIGRRSFWWYQCWTMVGLVPGSAITLTTQPHHAPAACCQVISNPAAGYRIPALPIHDRIEQ